MATAGSTQPSDPILVVKTMTIEASRWRHFFQYQDLWEVTAEGFVNPTEGTSLSISQTAKLKEPKQKDAKALFVQQAVKETIFLRIVRATSAKQAWDTLQEEFQGNTKVRTIKLQA
jgi:hypothetical protein